MIQEIIALVIFASAIVYGGFQLGLYFVPVKKTTGGGCGSGSCGCSQKT